MVIQDSEISRWHSALEIKDRGHPGFATWNPLNGTFIGNERVRVAELKHLSEFRLGMTIILVSITPKLATPPTAPKSH